MTQPDKDNFSPAQLQPLFLRHVPFYDLAVAGEFEGVGAVGEFDVTDAEPWVGTDCLFGCGEGLFAIGIAEDKRVPGGFFRGAFLS